MAGCFQESPEELDRLTKEDPAFKQMIQLRDQTRSQIQLIKDDLLNRKKQVDAQVEKLRGEYDATAKAQNKKIELLRAAIEQNHDLLQKNMDMEAASLQSKQEEFGGYQKTLSDVRKVLQESKGISFSKAERQKWEERILMLSEKMRPLSEEIQELKLQIRLKKQKIRYLK